MTGGWRLSNAFRKKVMYGNANIGFPPNAGFIIATIVDIISAPDLTIIITKSIHTIRLLVIIKQFYFIIASFKNERCFSYR